MLPLDPPQLYADSKRPTQIEEDPRRLRRNHLYTTRQFLCPTPFEWSFSRNGKARQISPDGRLVVNNPDLAVHAAMDGLGVAYTVVAQAEPFLRSGQLVRVLEDWSPCVEGLFLDYPGHRQIPTALRALIDMIRTLGNSTPSGATLTNPFVAA